MENLGFQGVRLDRQSQQPVLPFREVIVHTVILIEQATAGGPPWDRISRAAPRMPRARSTDSLSIGIRAPSRKPRCPSPGNQDCVDTASAPRPHKRRSGRNQQGRRHIQAGRLNISGFQTDRHNSADKALRLPAWSLYSRGSNNAASWIVTARLGIAVVLATCWGPSRDNFTRFCSELAALLSQPRRPRTNND